MKPLQPSVENTMEAKPPERLLIRAKEQKKEDKSDLSNIDEIERFIENFNDKQNDIESDFQTSGNIDRELLPNHFNNINNKIQSLQKFYSNSTFFLRIYDKKICQNSLHSLQDKFQDLEGKMLPKKKFGFKSRKNRVEKLEPQNNPDWVDASTKYEQLQLVETAGFKDKSNEELMLSAEQVERKDVLLSGLKGCSVTVLGSPSTLHIANVESCTVSCGPVATSVFIENAKHCTLQLACQQLRIHSTLSTDFYIHVTSKAIIEDSHDIRFGIYTFQYDTIDQHYDISNLNRLVNNWDKVDDFNWLVADKPSPNWSKITDTS